MNDAAPSPEELAELEVQLLELLNESPAGLSEHELLKRLRERHSLFVNFNAREPLSLFRGHYLLFHMLYRLRDRLGRERRGRLLIDPLRIFLEPRGWADGSPSSAASLAPSESDESSAWYGDLNRWATMTAAEVIELLDRFHAARRTNGRRRAALAGKTRWTTPPSSTITGVWRCDTILIGAATARGCARSMPRWRYWKPVPGGPPRPRSDLLPNGNGES